MISVETTPPEKAVARRKIPSPFCLRESVNLREFRAWRKVSEKKACFGRVLKPNSRQNLSEKLNKLSASVSSASAARQLVRCKCRRAAKSCGKLDQKWKKVRGAKKIYWKEREKKSREVKFSIRYLSSARKQREKRNVFLAVLSIKVSVHCVLFGEFRESKRGKLQHLAAS